jgi:propionate CoA-transferase
VAVEDGTLRIVREGRHAKFVRSLDQVSFHGPSALARGQQVLYVTERAVFELTDRGLRLVEIAPGVDLENEVLGRMEFAPELGAPVRGMAGIDKVC